MVQRTAGDEKRQAARIKFRISDQLEVRYKFLSHMPQFQCPKVFSGGALNISKGGALFVGTIPARDWLPQLGQGLVLIGMNIMVPDKKPVKALCSMRWTRPAPKGFHRFGDTAHYEFGVRFEQLDASHRNTLEKFLIGFQLKSRKFNREDAPYEGTLPDPNAG
jgi:c-di-GMP-binding flagellar brake protein YcgR